MRRRIPQRLSISAMLLAGALALSACGAGDDSSAASGRAGSDESAGATQTLRVGLLPFACCVTPAITEKLGFFEDEGLDVEFTRLSGGAEGVAAMEGGSLDLTHSPLVTLLQAREQGFDLVLVVADNAASKEPPAQGATLVRKDGPIQDYTDLEGKDVAINSLASVEFLALALAIRKAGGDDSAVNWIEIEQSQMVDGLLADQFQAAVTSEPAQSVGLATGELEVLGYQYVDSMPGLTLGTYTTTREFAEAHETAMEKFATAVKKTHEYLIDHPDEVIPLLAEALDADPETFESIVLPVWPTTVEDDSLNELVDLAVEFGFIENKVTPDEYVWESAY